MRGDDEAGGLVGGTARDAEESPLIRTVFADTLKRNEARSVTPHPHENDINTVIESNLGALWTGAKSPKEIVQAIATEASQYLVK